MRKVLVTTDAVGGVWTYAIDLAAGLRRYGIETVLAVLGPEPSREAIARAHSLATVVSTGLPLDWTARHPAEIEAGSREISRLASEISAGLVHLNSPALASYARFHMPVVAFAHSCVATWWDAVRSGPLPQDFEWRTELVGRGYRNASAVVAPSRAFAQATARRYRLTGVRTVHNGRAEPRTTREDLEPASDSPFVLTAGRLWDEGKNVTVLDAIADRVSVPIRAAGPLDGPQDARFEPRRLQALGPLADVTLRRLYARQPIFASPALYEPFGLAVLEAAQAGCPLVLSDIPTFRELWDGAATFVPARDEAGLASAIERLAADRVARARMGEAARQRALHYTPERMIERLLGIYRSVLSARDGGMEGAAA